MRESVRSTHTCRDKWKFRSKLSRRKNVCREIFRIEFCATLANKTFRSSPNSEAPDLATPYLRGRAAVYGCVSVWSHRMVSVPQPQEACGMRSCGMAPMWPQQQPALVETSTSPLERPSKNHQRDRKEKERKTNPTSRAPVEASTATESDAIASGTPWVPSASTAHLKKNGACTFATCAAQAACGKRERSTSLCNENRVDAVDDGKKQHQKRRVEDVGSRECDRANTGHSVLQDDCDSTHIEDGCIASTTWHPRAERMKDGRRCMWQQEGKGGEGRAASAPLPQPTGSMLLLRVPVEEEEGGEAGVERTT